MRKIHFVSKLLSVCLIAFGLFGCSSPSVTQYANEKPNLDLSEYFNGTIDAYGIFTDRSGEVKKRFTVLLVAQWKIIEIRFCLVPSEYSKLSSRVPTFLPSMIFHCATRRTVNRFLTSI